MELYRDRPPWPVTDDGTVAMDTLPLSLDPPREASTGADRLPSGTDLSHVHLEVSSLSGAQSFIRRRPRSHSDYRWVAKPVRRPTGNQLQ